MSQIKQINGYKEELEDELQKTDPNCHASRLIAQEIERLEKGEDRKDGRSVAFIDVHPDQPQQIGLKVRIPIQEYPKFNFVGKLLGPKGNTLKRLQEETGCKMAILGKGSMRDKAKEDELRKEGGKFAHLNDELHVYVEAFAEMTDSYRRLSHAVSELKKFLIPTSPSGEDEEMEQTISHDMSPLVEAFQLVLSQQLSTMPIDQQSPTSLMQKLSALCGLSQMGGPDLEILQQCLMSGHRPQFPPRGPVMPFPAPGPMFSPREPGPRFPPAGPGPMFPPPPPMFPFEQFMPIKKPKQPRPKPDRKPTPWYSSISEEFHVLKRLRRRAERKWLKSRSDEDRDAYVAVKRQFNELVRKAKAKLEPPKPREKKDEGKVLDDSEAESAVGTNKEENEGLCNEFIPGVDYSSGESSDDGDNDLNVEDSFTKDTVECPTKDIKESVVAKGTEDCVAESSEILEGNDEIREQQLQEMMYLNSGDAPRGGRGGFRGGRGGPAGRGAPPPPPPPGRGAPRGSAPRGGGGAPRGAPRGGAPAPRGSGAPLRGASRGRGGGGAPPPASSSYDDYGYGGSSRGGGGGGYDDSYDRGYGESSYSGGQGDGQYYGSSSYGSGGQSSASYDDYSSYNDYGAGDSWGSNGSGGGPMKSSRGGSKPRSHPYSGGRGGY